MITVVTPADLGPIWYHSKPSEQVFWPTKGTGGLQHHNFLISDGKQHPKNIWFTPDFCS
jgi:hypothetical protein